MVFMTTQTARIDNKNDLRRHFSVPSIIFFLIPTLFFISATIFFLPGSNNCHAESFPRRTVDKEEEITNFRIKIRQLQKHITTQQTRLSQSKAEERSILKELEILNNKLIRQKEKLDTLITKKNKQQQLIDKKEQTLTTIRAKKKKVEEHLKKRITAYFTMGHIGLLNVTFSAKSLPELLKFHDSFGYLIKYDQSVINSYKQTLKTLTSTKRTLDLEKTVLLDFIKRATEETKALETTRTIKSTLLAQVRTQSKLHQQAVREMQQATEKLSRSIVAIKTQNAYNEQGFLRNKGTLPPPVDGTLITLFQQTKKNKLGIERKSNGIELKAPDGTKIIAVRDGDVIFSGYLRGYGNTVIIHHGFQYFTVTSRIETLLVKQGQKVKTGDNIGIMGDTAVLFDEGLYFEIRHEKQPLDPLLWLDPNRLTTVNELSPEEGSPITRIIQ